MIKEIKNSPFGKFEVHDEFIKTRTGKKEVSTRKYKCVFQETGFVTYARTTDIATLSVRDYLYPVKDWLNVILMSNQDGPIKVLPEVYYNEKLKRSTYKVMFLNTGNTRFFTKKEIGTGKIKDIYKKRIYGVACIGNVSKKNNYKLYAIWYQMIKRCYDKNSKNYKRYGARGITVSDEWLCFENFIKTIEKVPNFDLDKIGQSRDSLHLDKDLLQINSENKVYSKETCIFLTNLDNIKIRTIENKLKKYKDIVQSLA